MRCLHVALGGAVAALALCGNGSAARAGDGDVQEPSITDKILSTFGLKDPNDVQYEINYSERSPLVVPPNRDLPPPVSPTALPAPNWPKDPDIKKRQEVKQDDDSKVTPRPYDSVMESSRPLRPGELGVGKPVSAPGNPEQSTPSELGEKKSSWLNFDWTKKEEYATFTGEPPRYNLTDPPPGYQTPSPDQPYGLVPEHKVYKPPTLGERMEPVR